MIQERMLGYYPEIIRQIYEIQAIIEAEYPEFELSTENAFEVARNAYLTTMSESRIAEWESLLGIIPSSEASVEDRRNTIIARIRGNGKLNTASIETIVNTFTGGSAVSKIEDGVIDIEILPTKKDRSYIFEDVENELKRRVPLHLGINVHRRFGTWQDIKNDFRTWGEVKRKCLEWRDVYIYLPASAYEGDDED